MDTLNIGGQAYEGSQAECFMTRFVEKSNGHPLDPKARILHNCAVLCFPANGNRVIRISSMDSLIRGSGSLALRELCDLADDCGIPLTLHAFGYADTPTEKLVEWYKRFGFGFVQGRGNRKEGWAMTREPHPTKGSRVIKLKGFDRPH